MIFQTSSESQSIYADADAILALPDKEIVTLLLSRNAAFCEIVHHPSFSEVLQSGKYNLRNIIFKAMINLAECDDDESQWSVIKKHIAVLHPLYCKDTSIAKTLEQYMMQLPKILKEDNLARSFELLLELKPYSYVVNYVVQVLSTPEEMG